MTQDNNNRGRQIVASEKKSRQDRLKLALRENLKRRKSQARGRSGAGDTSSEARGTSLDDAGEKQD